MSLTSQDSLNKVCLYLEQTFLCLGLCITVSCFADILSHQKGSGFFVPQESCTWEHKEPLFSASLFRMEALSRFFGSQCGKRGSCWGYFPDFTALLHTILYYLLFILNGLPTVHTATTFCKAVYHRAYSVCTCNPTHNFHFLLVLCRDSS